MEKKFIFMLIALCVAAPAVLADEISEENLEHIKLGMKQAEIVSVLGEPERIKAEGLNADGKAVENLEYQMAAVMGFPAEDARAVDERTIGQSANGFYNTSSHPKESRPTAYECSLVMVDGILKRIQKRPVTT